MKMTLLEIVQDVLNSLDSDNVNSISDTIESEQVAQIAKTCYFEIIGNRNWPHLRKLFQLESSGDLTKPNYLRIPETLKQLDFFRYEVEKDNGSIDSKEIQFKHPDEFLKLVSRRNSTENRVDVITDLGGSKLLIYNNVAPSYWTSFDDYYIVTDSYDKAVDDTLKKEKTQCLGYLHPSWVHSDNAIPNLPPEAFPALLSEVKSTAFVEVKQMANQKAEQKTARQQRWLSRKAWRVEGGVRYEDYGRKGRR
jgi:hypothetical protein